MDNGAILQSVDGLAQRLRTLRTEAGLTQDGLALTSQVSLRTIARIEAGARPNRSTVALLAHALGVHPNVLTVANGTPEAA